MRLFLPFLAICKYKTVMKPLRVAVCFGVIAASFVLLTGMPRSARALSIANVGVTATSVNWDVDMDAAVQSEFGPNYFMADWNDIVLYYQQGNDMSALTSLIGTGRRWVSLNGAEIYTGDRHYFINFSNHSTPSGFLVHAHVDDHLIDLGSFNNPRTILAFTAVPEPAPFTLLFASLVGFGLCGRARARRCAQVRDARARI